MTKDARDTLARDPPPTTSASSGSRIVTRESLLDAARRIYLPSTTPSSSSSGAISQCLDEISEYMSGTFQSTENVLPWWRDVGSRRFPALAKLARGFLAFCHTSAPAERLFSAGRAVVKYNRSS